MGTYINPGNNAFQRIIRSDYIDKTRMIALINKTIGTTRNLICFSRPRRFGKSYAAQMLCAYYDRSCDSHRLFSDYKIAVDETYRDHLNRYHVINLDITGFISDAKKNRQPLANIPEVIDKAIADEIKMLYPELKGIVNTNQCLLELVRNTGIKLVFVIDEWDSMIREASYDTDAQERYLNLLRGWFKNNNFTPEAVAAAYMTGILPIKKDGSQSAISDFYEYSMLEPLDYAEYAGFTEEEVKALCRKKSLDFEEMKSWYDGYTLGGVRSVYNPFSVMSAANTGRYKSYWKKTSAAETLMTYIDMDQEGLQEDIIRLMTGESIVVDTDSFQNDVETFTCKDDVFTLLIHLGYLSYEEVDDSYGGTGGELTGLARIPNEEVRLEFEKILRRANHKELIRLVRKSDQLLEDTLSGNSDNVAEAIQEIHNSGYGPTFYNNEQSLRYTIKMAYIACVDQYLRIEELPGGHGLADLVFLPKKRTSFPAVVIELKWNKTTEGAIEQIKDHDYPAVLKDYGGDILLVGINYDTKTKKHECRIEKYGVDAE